jgi:hypothetical protein
MQFDRSVGQTTNDVYYGFVADCLCAKVNLDLHINEDILELELELSIILLTMIILPIFLNREENLLVKLIGIAAVPFLSLIYGSLVNTTYKATHFFSRFTRGI